MLRGTASRNTTLLLQALLLLFASGCTTEIKTGKIRTGDEAFARKRYMLAAEMYQQEFKRVANDPTRQAWIAFNTGECYRYANKTIEAEQWYKQSADINKNEPASI